MLRSFFTAVVFLFLLAPGSVLGSTNLKPVLSLSLNWRPLSAGQSLEKTVELFDEDGSNKKAKDEFKSTLMRLMRSQGGSDSVKDVSSLRQAAIKLGPRARLLAELMAARVTGGVGPTGKKLTNPTGNWRSHLLAACNLAARIDDDVHQQTVMQALSLWRIIEMKDQSWASPPIDIKAQREFSIVKPVIERQAIYSWTKGDSAQALRKYRSLSRSLSGSLEGGTIDLRIVELEGQLYTKLKQLSRWQKVLVEFSEKYHDELVLGQGNESKVKSLNTQIARQHRGLIDSLIRDALSNKTSPAAQSAALKSINMYLSTNIPNEEKERVRALSGEIHFQAKNHKAAAGVFAALATESQGAKSLNFWRKAIRSQLELASWPTQPPWKEIPKGNTEARTVLMDMLQKTDIQKPTPWDLSANIGLLLYATGQRDQALNYWQEKFKTNTNGPHAARAAGWIAETRMSSSEWAKLEELGRLLLKARIIAVGKTKNYSPSDLLGKALLEGGLEALKTSDYKSAIAKLLEFKKSWRQDPRHDESMYSLAMAYQGDKQYRAAVQAMEDFTKIHRRSKFRQSGLKMGGEWTLALAWDDHVMYFLETHAREFPEDQDATNSLVTLSHLYLGREIYDGALRVMNSLLLRKNLDTETRADLARRLLDTAERFASTENALRIAERVQKLMRDNESISVIALSMRARFAAEKGKIRDLEQIDKTMSSLDQSQPLIAESISEVKFLLGESLARNQFKEEFFSLGARNPATELEKGYSLLSRINQNYQAACLTVRTGWCGPSLHRSARVSEQFLKSYEQLSISKTLDPNIVKAFQERKKSIFESVENQALEADEKSLEQAKLGATNPDWTSTILWQNGVDWNRDKYTSESATHYIQWRTR